MRIRDGKEREPDVNTRKIPVTVPSSKDRMLCQQRSGLSSRLSNRRLSDPNTLPAKNRLKKSFGSFQTSASKLTSR